MLSSREQTSLEDDYKLNVGAAVGSSGGARIFIGRAEADFLANRPTAKYLRAVAHTHVIQCTKVSAVNDVSSALAPSKLEPKTDKEQAKKKQSRAEEHCKTTN